MGVRKFIMQYASQIKKMRKYLKKLTNEPKMDLSSLSSVSKSIYKILKHEKFANRFKISVAVGSFLLTTIVAFIAVFRYESKPETLLIEGAFSTLISAILVEDAIDSKMHLLKALEFKINSIPEVKLKKKYLALLFEIIKSQSFPK